MDMSAASFFSLEPDSLDAGRLAGESVLQDFGDEKPKAVLIYATIDHDQSAVLQGLREVVGPHCAVLGCSTQGIVANDEIADDGLAIGAMAFGGAKLNCEVAHVLEIQQDSHAKGRDLAQRLKAGLGHEPKIVIVIYDPLCGADVVALLDGMRTEISCPLVGGGAAQPWGVPIETFQYFGQEVFSHGAVALALSGPFAADVRFSQGTAPTGIAMTVTKTVGTQILEIDQRPAVDIWQEATGCEKSELSHQSHMACWAVGVERRYIVEDAEGKREEVANLLRSAFGFDFDTGAVTLQTTVPNGAKLMFHHRTVEDVLNGSAAMGEVFGRQLAGRSPWAVLGFECAARTFPFLGPDHTRNEHRLLRSQVASSSPWLGMMAWGEIAPCGGEPGFHNFTYPLVTLTAEIT